MQLRDFRQMKAWTLQELANLMGYANPRTVERHEKGTRFPQSVDIEKYQQLSDGAVRFEDFVALKKAREKDALPAADAPKQTETTYERT